MKIVGQKPVSNDRISRNNNKFSNRRAFISISGGIQCWQVEDEAGDACSHKICREYAAKEKQRAFPADAKDTIRFSKSRIFVTVLTHLRVHVGIQIHIMW